MARVFPPVWRKLVQALSCLATNPHLANFARGALYTGAGKRLCAPGLNCYSCPAATAACPVGALQTVVSSPRFNFSCYAAGCILAFGAICGRAVCGFLCPFGLVQEALHKIPGPKPRLWKRARYIKYAVLALFVLILPAADTNYAGAGKPAFCQYLCPAGTLEGAVPLLATHPELRPALGALFILKVSVLVAVLALCVLFHRFFCRALCPLGAIYGLLNKVSVLGLRVDPSACIRCGACARACRMDVNPADAPRSAECIRCGDCARACPTRALSMQPSFRARNATSPRTGACGHNSRNPQGSGGGSSPA